MIMLLLRKTILFFSSTIVLLMLTFWFYVRVTKANTDEIPLNLWNYLKVITSFDFGYSSQTGNLVISDFFQYFAASAELAAVTLVFSIIVGLIIGTYSSLHKDTIVDSMITNTSIFFSAIPVFWLAQILIAVISVNMESIPSQNRISLLYDVPPRTGFMLIDSLLVYESQGFAAFFNAASHFLLPVIAMAILPITEIIRITRNSLYTVMQQNYIKLSFSRGYSPFYVITHHALRNALPNIFKQCNSVILMGFTSIIVVEYAFNWPGIGTMIIEAIKGNDYNMMNLYLLFIGIMFITINVILETLAEMSVLFRREGIINGQ